VATGPLVRVRGDDSWIAPTSGADSCGLRY